jgi:hypothetical protein
MPRLDRKTPAIQGKYPRHSLLQHAFNPTRKTR